MKNTLLKGSLVITGIVLGVSLSVPLLVQAQESVTDDPNNSSEVEKTEQTEGTNNNSTQTNPETRRSEITNAREERKEVAREKLKDAKLRICTERQDNVNKIMDRVVDRSKAQIDRISSIVERVKGFYEKQGQVLDTYDALVADVDAKKAIALTALEALTTKSTFSCSSDGPKSDIADFNSDRLKKKVAIDDYRKSVKALIAGVKSIQTEKTAEGGAN